MHFSRLKRKQQITCGIVSAALAFSFLPADPLKVSAEGSLTGNGTAQSPYEISSEADLIAFRNLVNNGNPDISGILTTDITVSADWTPIGDYNAELTYTGTFNGGGYTITLNATDSSRNYQGLFGYNAGTIDNVTVAGTISGTEYAGGIAAINKGSITNSKNQAAVTTADPVSFAGGIAGINYSTITDSNNTGSVTSTSAGSCAGGITGASPSGTVSDSVNSGSISGTGANAQDEYKESCVGGIVGLNYDSEILTSSNTGNITSTDADSYVGGITGLNNGAVTDSYNAGSVDGPHYVGGIAGYLFKNEKIDRQPSVRNTLNTGSIHTENTTYYGSIYGGNQGGSSYNNYYETTVPGSDNPDALGVTAEELRSGKVTYLLNENTSDESSQWRQTLATDEKPVLNPESSVVYAVFQNGVITGYTNDKDQSHEHSFNEHGKCTVENCGYESISLKGHSLTLDGAIGANYYYYIDPMYLNGDYEIKAVFTARTSKMTASFDPDFSILTDDNTKLYGFKVYVFSNYISDPIDSELQITKKGSDKPYTLKEEDYRIYNYLNELYTSNSSSSELKNLAQTLATYDYYSAKRFDSEDKVLPSEIPHVSIDSVTDEQLESYRTVIGSEEDYPVKHYAHSLLLQSSTGIRAYMHLDSSSLDAKNIVMGYKLHGSLENYTYTSLKKSGNYYYGDTAKIPASKLGDAYDIAFFQIEEDGSYTQVSAVKKISAYSYVYGVVSTGTTSQANRDVSKALYLYGEASRAYFNSLEP